MTDRLPRSRELGCKPTQHAIAFNSCVSDSSRILDKNLGFARPSKLGQGAVPSPLCRRACRTWRRTFPRRAAWLPDAVKREGVSPGHVCALQGARWRSSTGCAARDRAHKLCQASRPLTAAAAAVSTWQRTAPSPRPRRRARSRRQPCSCTPAARAGARG
jgi:hypothetical protein